MAWWILRTRIGSLFSRVKWPGWFMIAWSIFWWTPEVYGKFDFWLNAAREIGGRLGQIAAVVTSPWFNLALMVIGIAYLCFVGESERAVRHPIWPILGWVVVSFVALAFWSVLVAGYVATYVPQQGVTEAKAQIDSLTQVTEDQKKKLAHALSEAEKLTAQINEMKAQHAPRHIKDFKRFISMLSLFRGQIVDVEHIATNQEAENFIGLIRNVVELSGWTIGDATAMVGQTWNGVIIEVNDLREAMPAAYELRNLLAQQGTEVVIRPRSGPFMPGRFKIRVGYRMPGRMTN